MSDAVKVTQKIMALVDEYPSGPFSFERRQVEIKIEEILTNFTDSSEEANDAFYEEGREEGRAQAAEDYETEIQDLESEIEDLRAELEEANDRIDQAFAEGYASANQLA